MSRDQGTLAYDDSFARAYDDIFSDMAENAAPVDFLAACFEGVEVLLELGVGTGRIALPLAGRGYRIIGVDDSGAMLERLHAKDATGAGVDARQADMADLDPQIRAGGVYSVLGSLSCLLDSEARRRVFAQAAGAVPAGARFVLEVYNPAVIRSMHAGRRDPVSVDLDYPGRGTLTSRYTLSADGSVWSADHRWQARSEVTTFHEALALVDPLDIVAEADPWWRPVALLRDWSGAPLDAEQGALLVVVLERNSEEGAS
ncbi:class I SAM-dependent DNA methyltransferase [Microbacterium sp. NPDC012755]|uniref:class I SAM-dependent DNA methyltransferase n=1 Tax=Microbacterium sp. NPDC012755 TaxID=3364184 RepID=UPI0036975A5F